MRRSVAALTVGLAMGAMSLAPGTGTPAQYPGEEGPIEIEKCQTISKPGSYVLVKNLVSTGGNCLVLAADHITIELAGFSISGNGTGAGVAAIGGAPLRGIAVRNGSISNFAVEVLLEAADGSIVEGLRLSGLRPAAGGVGIDAHGVVRGNTLISIPATGILASGIITDNYISDSGAGIGAGAGSTVIGNTAVNNAKAGIAANCPSNVTNNTAVNNGVNLQLIFEGCNSTDNVAP